MCGIAGFYGHFEPELLGRMRDKIAHRGVDDAGQNIFECHDQRVGLAHQRLTIIDLSHAGHQPMTISCERSGSNDSNGRIWLIFNGELYNFRELKKDLQALGHNFKSSSDSEVILHLYAEYGPSMLEMMNGIFAFAIYDGRKKGAKNGLGRHDLFLARDGLGVKPLYYSHGKNGFLFASELKAILEYEQGNKDIDIHSLYYYLSYLWAPAPHTMIKNISKLEPGSAMVIRRGKIFKKWFFYDIPYGSEPFIENESQIAQNLAGKIKQAVSRQMVSDVPVGAFLSGGLDSSSIVAFASKMNQNQKLDCFTIDLKTSGKFDGFSDDLPFARQVAKDLDVRLHTVAAGPDIMDRLEEMIYFLDEPQADPAPLNALLICELANRHGIKVLLSGAGGDDILSGYRRHVALEYEKYWSGLPRAVRSAGKKISQNIPGKFPMGRRLVKALSSADLSREDRLVNYFQWIENTALMNCFSDRLKADFVADPPKNLLKKSLLRIPGEKDRLNRMLYLEAKHFLADHNLNYTDKMGMAAGVEVRVPLLDPDLVAFAVKIPSHLKQKGRTGKYIFKKAMEPYLSKNIIYRPKTGFGAPLRQWIHGDLRPAVMELLNEKSINKYGFFNPVKIGQLIEDDYKGKIDASYTIFSLMCIQWWMKLFG